MTTNNIAQQCASCDHEGYHRRSFSDDDYKPPPVRRNQTVSPPTVPPPLIPRNHEPGNTLFCTSSNDNHESHNVAELPNFIFEEGKESDRARKSRRENTRLHPRRRILPAEHCSQTSQESSSLPLPNLRMMALRPRQCYFRPIEPPESDSSPKR